MSKKILYCVLNWGLGHASRSIPIIEQQIDNGHTVEIASDGTPLHLLKKAFPALTFHNLPGYDIDYTYESIAANILRQSFKILRAIKTENKVIKDLVAERKFDHIISDNRYGTYHPSCYNIFISHQLRLLHPNRFLQAAATKLNQRLIQRFNECWIPDTVDHLLSGEMSHGNHISIPVKYIGPVSRFSRIKLPENPEFTSVSILSGPEPQRSILQHKLEQELKNIEGKHIIVTGLVQESITIDNLIITGLMTVEELSDLITRSKYIISRAGYSSILDYAAMERKAILIPTPGQTEQEYLGRLHGKRGTHIVLDQNAIELKYLLSR